MIKYSTKIVLSGIILSFGLGACGSSPNAKVERVTGVVDGQTANGYSKPGATVSLDYDAVKRLEPGQVGDLNINFGISNNATAMTASFNGSDGLEIISGGSVSVDLTTDELSEHSISYTAATEGRYFVHSYVTVTGSTGVTQGRALSIPVQVGDSTEVRSKSTGTVQQNIGGEKVIVMQAEETIK